MVANIKVSGTSKAEKNRRRRQKRKAKKNGLNQTPGTAGGAIVIPMNVGKKKNKKRGSGSGVAAGEVTIARSEYLTEVKTSDQGKASGDFILDVMNFPWLSNIAKAFERIRWNSAVIEYRPAVGTTSDGLFCLGFDWGDKSAAALERQENGFLGFYKTVERSAVLACTPANDTQVWNKTRMNIPAGRLQSRQWYEIPASTTTSVAVYDRAPGSVVYSASSGNSKVVGELWIHYSVRLSGTRKV